MRLTHTLSLFSATAALIVTAGTVCGDAPAPTASPFDDGPGLFGPRRIGVIQELRDGYGPGVQAAADWVIADQCGDGGWSWPSGDCPNTHHNITAPIALALLKAYSITGDGGTLDAAVAGGDFDLTGVWAGSGDTAFGSFTPYFFWKLSQVTGDSTYSVNAAEDFFDKLTAGTYGDAEAPWFPGDTYDYLDRHKAKRSGSLINLRPWDMLYMPFVAGQIGNPNSSGTDGVSQQQTFLNDAVLDGLNTLDNTDPDNVPWDLTGLAGAVYGVALNGTTSFTALTSPNFAALQGLDTLSEIADLLAGYQSTDGSWYWSSNLSDPTESDKDTQTTAYAVLALVEAQEQGCGPYDKEIARGRSWLDTMQQTDGWFLGYPGDTGPPYTEVVGEALDAIAISNLSLTSTSCESGGQLVVEIEMAEMPTMIAGGQFFLEYDDGLLQVASVEPGDAPFTEELYEATGTLGEIDYIIGVPFGDPGDYGPATLAVITFNVLGEDCSAEDLVTFRQHDPPTRLTDMFGEPVLPTQENLPTITLDQTPPTITCPDDITVNADAGVCDYTTPLTETFDDAVPVCASQAPDCWYPDRYPPDAFEQYDFGGGESVLLIGISEDDSYGNRPGGYQSLFYNTQGRKYDLWTPVPVTLSADVYIPSVWSSDARRTDLWATAFSSTDADVTGYPIIGFVNNDPDDSVNPDPNPANLVPRFRVWMDEGLGGWVDLGLPSGFTYDAWYTMEVEITHSAYNYRVIGDSGTLTYTYPKSEALATIGNVMLQGYNFGDATYPVGDSYDIYWDNLQFGPEGATATDNCTVATIVGVRSDSLPLTDPYPVGTTTITWTATDACGNSDDCVQTVTVDEFNEVEVTVQLSPNIDTDDTFPQTLSRCITFELWDCVGGYGPVEHQQVVDFEVTAGSPNVAIGTATLLVPCDVYDCMTARDELHTLRRTDEGFTIVGTQYVADFTGDVASGGDWLIGGNLNDDSYIDVLDFGVFVWQWQAHYDSDGDSIDDGHTPCGTEYPHADVNGDGYVDSDDFTFIQTHFLAWHEDNCCGLPPFPLGGAKLGATANGPVTRISLRDLARHGMPQLIVADLNGDGWLDTKDMEAFAAGARP